MATKKKAPPRPAALAAKKGGKKKSAKKSAKKAPKKKAPKKAPKKKAPKKAPAKKRVNKPRRGKQPALVIASGHHLQRAKVASVLTEAERLTVELRGTGTAWMPDADDATGPAIIVYTMDDGKLVASKRAKQGARMLKVLCKKCGYNLRTTHKWLEQGIPACPLGHGEMDAPDVETEEA